ncbi:MAG: tail fiber protein [Pseudomonadota bacterium]
MSEPFLAEVRMVGFNFAPRGWAFCDGQILPINQNQSLYSLLGTTYGGDGRTSFALPDLRGRTPMHVGRASPSGTNHPQGQKEGTETHTLAINEMPAHGHGANGTSSAVSTNSVTGNMLGTNTGNPYAPLAAAPAAQSMNASTIGTVGGDQGHENMQPWLAVNFCIALRGLFPSRS